MCQGAFRIRSRQSYVPEDLYQFPSIFFLLLKHLSKNITTMNSQDKRDFFDALDVVDISSSDEDMDLNLTAPIPSSPQPASSRKRKIDDAEKSSPSAGQSSKGQDKAELYSALEELNRHRPKLKKTPAAPTPKPVPSSRRPPPIKAKSAPSVPKKAPTLTRSQSSKSSASLPASTLLSGLVFCMFLCSPTPD